MVSHSPRTTSEPLLDERVRSLLAAAAAPAEPGPLPGEEEAVAAFVASAHPRRIPMRSSLSTRRIALASSLGAVALLAGGVGAAAAGVLPGAAQDSVSDLLGSVGVQVPGADEHSAGHADQRGGSTDDAGEAGTGDGADVETEDAGKGAAVSGIARQEGLEGVDKGAAVSGHASGGKSQAGRHGAATDSEPEPPVVAPHGGGTGTATDATDETAAGSSEGTNAADEASSGHSAAGSGNRP